MLDDSHKYDDIIDLRPPTSERHPRIPLYDRAAQFAPFAALTGHNAAISETARLTDERLELSDDAKDNLNQKLQMIEELSEPEVPVSVTYFVPDEKKKGGRYITKTGFIKRIDEYERNVVFRDKTLIPIDEIIEIQSELFNE